MAIKVGGTSIIDDNKNISNVGIVTIGGSTSGTLEVGNDTGIGITATGDGTISIAGTLSAFDLVTPLKIEGFIPGDGSTGASETTTITVLFNNTISVGATGYVRIQSGTGKVIDTFGVGSQNVEFQGKQLKITPSENIAKGTPGFANTIKTMIDASYINDPKFLGINTTGSNVTYLFEIETAALGDATSGGYLICVGGGSQWIVAPRSTEVSRSWGGINDAVTTANLSAACGDWFVPTCGQLQNPGSNCRTYWSTGDAAYSNSSYWSSSRWNSEQAWWVSINSGGASRGAHGAGNNCLGCIMCVRAFRCVSY